jgi:TetR/AcrR family transcriptional regulator of autoinduction and epiphytic fitness
MPANRPHVDHDEKAAEILDAAESLLIRDGYGPTTMAAIAHAAGVSSNAVYWYFPGKDELLAAVLRRRQERGFARLDQANGAPLRDRALAVLGELDAIAKLTAAVHERARSSDAVAEAHRAFHAEVDRRVRADFEAAGLEPEDARLAAAGIIAMVEGVHLHDEERDPEARDELVLWALRSFLATRPAG